MRTPLHICIYTMIYIYIHTCIHIHRCTYSFTYTFGLNIVYAFARIRATKCRCRLVCFGMGSSEGMSLRNGSPAKTRRAVRRQSRQLCIPGVASGAYRHISVLYPASPKPMIKITRMMMLLMMLMMMMIMVVIMVMMMMMMMHPQHIPLEYQSNNDLLPSFSCASFGKAADSPHLLLAASPGAQC